MVERDSMIFGRGTCDMKGFIAATVAMAPLFCATGCIGAGHLAQNLTERPIKPSFAIIEEP
jgi:acetylornithine deacetylase